MSDERLHNEEAMLSKQDAKKQESNDREHKISETWAEETIADLDDFIESQGIYIRQ